MGKLIAVENKGADLLFIGDNIVAPGDCRHFDEDLVPAHLRPAEPPSDAEPSPVPSVEKDPVAEAFGCKSDELLDAIDAAVTKTPEGAEDIAELEEARDGINALIEGEQAAAKPRQDVVESLGVLQLAIAEGLVKAAAAKEKAEQEKAGAQPAATTSLSGTAVAAPPSEKPKAKGR